MSERDEMKSGRNSERGGLATRARPPESRKIEHDIEVTLSHMRATLDEIQENLSPGRLFAPVKTFLGSTAGRSLLVLGAVTIARRRPFLTTAAAMVAMVFLSRGKNRRSR